MIANRKRSKRGSNRTHCQHPNPRAQRIAAADAVPDVLKAVDPAAVPALVVALTVGVSAMIEDPRIVAVAVTGSVRAGAAIARQAGAALKKSILELGGSDAFIVLADTDLDAAVRSAVTGRFQNTGQVCLAAKRIIVELPIAEAFEARFVEAVRRLKLGDPLQEDTYIGPMARYDLRDELHRQVDESVAEGARLVMGGHKLEGAGNFYAPTVLADVRPGMVAFGEELFGPVASLTVARDAAHAVELANVCFGVQC